MPGIAGLVLGISRRINWSRAPGEFAAAAEFGKPSAAVALKIASEQAEFRHLGNQLGGEAPGLEYLRDEQKGAFVNEPRGGRPAPAIPLQGADR